MKILLSCLTCLTCLTCLCRLSVLADEQLKVIGELGQNMVLPCHGFPKDATSVETQWKKNGTVVISGVHSAPAGEGHYSVQDDGSLKITGVLTLDEAVYQCDPTPRNGSVSQPIVLTVAGGPSDMKLAVVPVTTLPNGTLFVIKGDNVLLNCSSKSYPSQNLSWIFQDAAQNETEKGFGTGSELDFKIFHIQPKDQGNYTCRAQNPISMITTEQSVMLLVYYVSDLHPECFWHPGTKLDQVFFNCSWTGNYPPPMLQVFLDSKTSPKPSTVGSKVTENIELSLSRNMVYEGQNITCKGQYTTPLSQEEKYCTLTLKAPYPEGAPMVAALQGTNVTLTCSELVSMPPAVTVWYRWLNYTAITPSAKYILNEQGPYRTLTIIGVGKEDEGIFVCKSENVVAERVLEVFLTVRSSVGSGVAFGLFISIFIVAAGVAVGYLLYSRRDRICLGLRLSSPDERADVISLIESDEDEIFHDTVPRLPPVLNGSCSTHATTLVEIHHIHGGDHEENVNNAEQNQAQDQTQLDEEQ